jgi:hypothetical protein
MFSSSNDITSPVYKNLDEIRLRKAQLLTEITKDSNKMKDMWTGLFHKPKDNVTPTSRFSGFMKTGAGVVDGLILGWKLYRKFGGGSKKSKNKFLGLF